MGRPGTEVAMALSSLSLPSQIELHCTSPHVPSIALRDVNLTTVSSPTTIHPHIPIIAGATSSGRVLLWDWLLFCRKKGKSLKPASGFGRSFYLPEKYLSYQTKHVSGWFQFLDLTDESISWRTILCVVHSWSWSESLLTSVNCLEWILATPPQHLCCYSLRHSGFETA